MSNRNTINGEKPEFGNQRHIKWYKEKSAIMQGKASFHTIDWQRASYWGKHTESGKPIFNYSQSGSAVVDYVPCPKCNRLHVLLYTFDPQGVWYSEMLAIDEDLKVGFECWNCGLEMFMDDESGERQLFVMTNENINL